MLVYIGTYQYILIIWIIHIYENLIFSNAG